MNDFNHTIPSTAARAPDPARLVLTGEEFVQYLTGDPPRPSAPREVLGAVDLRGRTIWHLVEVRDVVFHHPVHLSSSTFRRGLDLTGCRFMQGLVMANTCVQGPLILDGTILGMETDLSPDVRMLERFAAELEERRPRLRTGRDAPREQRVRRARMRLRARRRVREWRQRVAEEKERQRIAEETRQDRPARETVADFTNLRVQGALSMVNARVYGRITCLHADIEDDFRIDGAHIRGDILLRRSNLGEFRTEGRVLSPAGTTTDEVHTRCFVGGDLDLTSTHVAGDVRLIGITVRGHVSLQAAEVDGNILCRRSAEQRTSVGRDAWFLGLRVKGKLTLTGPRIYGDLNLNVVEVGGSLDGWSNGWVLDVGGGIDASNPRIAASIELTGARVREKLTLDGARIGGSLNLSGADLGRDVNLQGCVVGDTVFCRVSEGPQPPRPFRVGGELWLMGAAIGGDLDLSGADVTGELVLQNSSVGQNLLANSMSGFCTRVGGTATLDGLKVTGDVSWVGATLADSMTMDAASVGGDVTFGAARDGERVTPCSVGKKLRMPGATVGGSVLIGGTQIGTHLEMQGTRVGHRIELCTSEGVRTVVNRSAELEGVQVSGNLALEGVTIREALVVERASITGNLKVLFDLVHLPGWRLERTELGSLQAESASVGKDVVLVGAVVGPAPDAAAGWRRGVNLSGVRVGGKLQLHRPGAGKDNLHAQKTDSESCEIPAAREAELLAQADGEGAVIHGDLRLNRAEVAGDVVLDDVAVHGDLDLRNARVGASLFCRTVRARRPEPAPGATARRADCEGLQVSGDAELTGLSLSGDLVLCDCRIGGQLRLINERRNDGARIRGNVDLDSAEVAHAVLSGANFTLWTAHPDTGGAASPCPQCLKARVMHAVRGDDPEQRTTARPRHGILLLERASIRKLEILRPLPAELYLSDLKVASWEESVRYFEEMLQQTRPFRKSCYVTIESDLRNKGRDADADSVHVWMRRRDRRNTRDFWPVAWDRFLDLTTEYGTTSRRLFKIMLLWFALSLLVFLDNGHVQYDVLPTAQAAPPPEPRVPPGRWNVADAVFLAVRLHVPIVSLGINEPVQPRQTLGRLYALISIAASWLMWPLFIASASGYLRRKT